MTTNIYTALSAVMADVDHVAKRDINQHQRFNFRGIDAVVNAVGPALRKHNVIVVPEVESADYADVKTSTGKPATACRLVVAYTFHAADGSSITTRVAGEAWDNGDKAAPKAMSVAFRTALLQALALPTDEPDPDHETFEKAAPKRQPRQQAPAPQQPPKPATGGGADATDAMRRKKMFATLRNIGKSAKADALPYIASIIGRDIESTSELSRADVSAVIEAAEAQERVQGELGGAEWPEPAAPGGIA